jgi:hypothetical protein
MLYSSPRFRPLLCALAFCALNGAAEAQPPQVTLTVTNNGVVSGAVGVQGPNGNVCNPNPGGGAGGGTCVFTYDAGTPLRIAANSPNPDAGFLHSGTGDAATCATSTCNIVLTTNSAITATFDASQGPVASIETTLLGDGKGTVYTDNGTCQDFELGYTDCTTYYAVGSQVKFVAQSMPGNIFESYSGGIGDTAICGANSTCVFTATVNSSVNVTSAALVSVAIEPPAATINVSNGAFFSARGTFTNGMTRFSFNGNTPWQGHTQMDVARFSLAAAAVGERLYALGGVSGFCPPDSGPCPFSPLGTVEIFNPQVTATAEFELAWMPRQSMTIARGSLAAVAVGGRIYAIGGYTLGGDAVASMEFYDPSTNSWSARAPMSGPRAELAAAVINNTIYVLGGNSATGGAPTIPLATVEAYDTLTNSWTPKPSMLTARSFPAAAAVNGILYAIGGDGTGSVEAYDPATNAWTMKAPIPSGGGSHRAVALNGLIYAVGGLPVTVKVYNPAFDSWVTLVGGSPLPVSGQFALAMFDGRLFAAGGNTVPDNTATRTFAANRPPEATWWSSNPAVGRINSGNSGSVQGLSVGTATISARLVTVDSGAQSALLTVNPSGGGGGGGSIFLGIPTDPSGGGNATSTQVGHANWGCGTFSDTSASPGPWEVTINYGDGSGNQPTPYSPPPGPCGGGPGTDGVFFFNHAYTSPGTFLVTVTVRNPSTTTSTTRTFHVEVQEGNGGGGDDCAPIVANTTVIGTVPFETVHVSVFDRATGDFLFEGDLPLGFFDDGALPAGEYRIELSVPAGYMVTPSSFIVDAVCGEPIILNSTVQAIPADPPAITLALSPTTLWPPNNRMRTVSVTIGTSAPDGHATTVELVSITSSEPGDDDIQGAAFGTDDRTFELRAQRLGNGPGRTYTVTYQVTDTVTGLSTTASTTVVVPHDQGQ